jgi:type II secretory pathway pseudopilin PulG
MADEEPGRELPQRVRGTARSGPAARTSSPSPVLSEELRQRIRAAVTAERSGAVAKPDEAPGGEATSSGPARSVRPETPAVSEPPVRPARAANAGPVPEDEITEWLSTTIKQPSEVKPASGGKPASGEPASGIKPEPPVRPGAAGQFPADSPRHPGRSRARRAAGLVAVVLVIGVLAAGAVRYLGRSQADSRASAAAAREAAKARAAAASWVAQQVSRDVRVSCDPAMCATLKARGFPPSELLVLGPASEVPRSSAVVVETSTVLSLFGSSLATAWAPVVLASFGSGPSLVTVRVVAPNGAAAYQTRLGTDLADRKTAGAALLHDKQISVPALASGQLAAGAVDSRLLEALVFVAGHQSISIVQFGNPGPGASADLPLRYVDLAERDPAGHLSPATYVRSLRAYLSTADVTFRPASMATVVLVDGQAVLRIEVTAPSPLGVFGPPSSP